VLLLLSITLLRASTIVKILEVSMNNNILLIEGVHPQAQRLFEKQDFHVSALTSSASDEQLLQAGPYVALGIRSRTELSSDFFNQSGDLLSVGAFCIGINQIHLQSATQKGIAVFNSPYSNTRSVAELTLANIINLSRKITQLNHLAHLGKWKKTSQSSYEVRGKVLGIIGYGHIGSQVSVLAEALGMKIYYYDTQKKLSLGNAQPVSSLEEILPLCDFLTLHVPQTPQTKNMITKKEFQKMKKGSYLINTSRGSTVCLSDLVTTLKEGHLNGAAIDVFPEEPSGNNEVFSNDLQKMDNVILTPHIGGSTEEAQVGIANDVAQRLIDYLKRGDSSGSVNFPQLSPPPILNKERTLRVANIHKNTAGVLSEINNLISKWNINVKTQYLATAADIGYVIIDIELEDQKKSLDIARAIQKLETSIKTRILS